MGLTRPRAAQIFDIDYKQATRAIATADVALTGGAPALVDGVTLVTNDRILVTGQTDASDNGIYTVTVVGIGSDGTWVRANDSNEDGEIQAGMVVMITEGVSFHDTQWKLTSDNPIDIGTTSLVFSINSSPTYTDSDVATYLASGTVSTAINTTSTISAGGTVTGTDFNCVTASAQYADLAENYLADADYVPGTVVDFGGVHEVTLSITGHSTAVAGIVSTAPAYLMNSHLQGEHVVAVALTGRVPCRVQGPVNKGTVLVTGTVPGTAMAIVSDKFQPGCVVGKAMEEIVSATVQLIEVAVGRL